MCVCVCVCVCVLEEVYVSGRGTKDCMVNLTKLTNMQMAQKLGLQKTKQRKERAQQKERAQSEREAEEEPQEMSDVPEEEEEVRKHFFWWGAEGGRAGKRRGEDEIATRRL